MILIDTGFFVALFDPGDQLHPVAVSWSAVLTERLIVTEYVLVEIVNHFSRQAWRPRALDILDEVLTNPSYEFIPASIGMLNEGLDLYRRSGDKEWSLTDCISFNIMRQHNVARALAYDRHFEQAGFEALLRRDPP